jgi:uncharacterized Tic20 family protein
MDLNETNHDFKVWAMFCHLITFLGFIIPFGNFIGVISLWLCKRKESDFVNENGKEAINFQLLCLLVFVICLLLSPYVIGFIITLIIALVFSIYAVFEIVLAAREANRGMVYKYKYSLRLLK